MRTGLRINVVNGDFAAQVLRPVEAALFRGNPARFYCPAFRNKHASFLQKTPGELNHGKLMCHGRHEWESAAYPASSLARLDWAFK